MLTISQYHLLSLAAIFLEESRVTNEITIEDNIGQKSHEGGPLKLEGSKKRFRVLRLPSELNITIGESLDMFRYPLVIKHVVLENTLIISFGDFLVKPQFPEGKLGITFGAPLKMAISGVRRWPRPKAENHVLRRRSSVRQWPGEKGRQR